MINFRTLKSLNEISEISDPIFSSLCSGLSIEHAEKMQGLFRDAVHNYSHLFTDDIFTKVNENSCLLEYILPSIRKVYSKFFINTPSIFSDGTNALGLKHRNFRLELFQLQFELGDFLKFLSEKIIKNYNCLDDFKNLDVYTELLTLIVEDYVASKISFVASIGVSDIESEIRNIKLTRHLKI